MFVSNRYIYTQLIDDRSGQTIVGLHLKSIKEAPTTVGAEKLGRALAGQAKERQISRVVFDRGARAYAGRVQALAEGARAGGLEF